MLIDQANIFVRSGRGGDGHVSFARYKYIAKGGPNGGDGGKGGSVILRAEAGIDTLLDLAGHHHWHAKDGEPGSFKQCAGKDADDLVIRVPPGTQVFDDDTGQLLADLDAPGQEILVAKGGAGGFGNEHFKSSTNQAPTQSTPGGEPEERSLRLELKLIADIGLVGKPNAGKSTLLSRISRARPKIADYPFTTLEPHLGIADLPSATHRAGRRLVFADIPGLIEGAHRGHGLGIQFLRHVERTKLLVHLLEIEPTDGSSPVDNFHIINHELASHSAMLADKPQVVVVTKMDLLPSPEDRQAARELLEQELGVPVLPISAPTGEGLLDLLELCWRILKPDPDQPAPATLTAAQIIAREAARAQARAKAAKPRRKPAARKASARKPARKPPAKRPPAKSAKPRPRRKPPAKPQS